MKSPGGAPAPPLARCQGPFPVMQPHYTALIWTPVGYSAMHNFTTSPCTELHLHWVPFVARHEQKLK